VNSALDRMLIGEALAQLSPDHRAVVRRSYYLGCCKHVGAGRIVVMSTPHAAESVARLVLSAMQCADHYFQPAVRNR
jgi:hypothetical protein